VKEKMFEVMKAIIELDETNFEAEVMQAAGPVLVDFYAPWCGPCKMRAPFLEELTGEFSGRIKFAKVNVDDAPKLADQYNITGVPTLILFRAGKIIRQIVGLPSARSLTDALEQATGSVTPVC
jgi:thioredoxin